MLYKATSLNGYKLHSLDGEIGKVSEFYFDDQHWTIRYLIADTGTWLTSRQVLISPFALTSVNHDKHFIVVDLTKKQIEDCPPLSNDQPVSRQYEESYNGYYGMPRYWGGPLMWGAYLYPAQRTEWKMPSNEAKGWDFHLRSTRDVTGHHIQATDGEIGHVEDFVIDTETWAIRYLIINTHNWLAGKTVLISPQWIERISWNDRKVFINHSRETIKLSPQHSHNSELTRDYEIVLHGHYNHQGYWVDNLATK